MLRASPHAAARAAVDCVGTSRCTGAHPCDTDHSHESGAAPSAFSLNVPDTALDPRASLSVFAEIRDGTRLMFITDTRHPAPQEGVKGMGVRLTFVASARGDPARAASSRRRLHVSLRERHVQSRIRGAACPRHGAGRLARDVAPPQYRRRPRATTHLLRWAHDLRSRNRRHRRPRVLFARGRMVRAQCVAQR